jgi:hypothetical protein
VVSDKRRSHIHPCRLMSPNFLSCNFPHMPFSLPSHAPPFSLFPFPSSVLLTPILHIHIVKHKILIASQISLQYPQFYRLNENSPVCAIPIKYVAKFFPHLNFVEKICPSISIEQYLQPKNRKDSQHSLREPLSNGLLRSYGGLSIYHSFLRFLYIN